MGFSLLVLMMALLVTAQNIEFHSPTFAPKPAAQHRAAAAPKKPAQEKAETPARPSVFELETAMTHAELMRRWDPMIKAASKRFGVPEKWIRAVMRQESGGRTMLAEGVKIVSRVGAMGLMQVMPETYADLRKEHNLGADPFDPQDNIYAGAAYLRWLKARYGLSGMFAAYNAGPGTYEAARAGKSAFPEETLNYARNVARNLGLQTPEFADGASVRLASATSSQLANYRRILLTIPLSPYNQLNNRASDDNAGRMYVVKDASTGQAPAPAPPSSIAPAARTVEAAQAAGESVRPVVPQVQTMVRQAAVATGKALVVE